MILKLELIVKLDFAATHSLEENEVPHPHRWGIKTTLIGKNKSGRIISLPKAQKIFRTVLGKIEGTHLNSNHFLDKATREVPTCENLAHYLFDAFSTALKASVPEDPSLKITQIEVSVNETVDAGLSGTGILGSARLTDIELLLSDRVS